MLKKPLIIIALIVLFLAAASPALAQFGLKETAQNIGGYDTSGRQNVYSVLNTVINVILSLLGILFLGTTTYAGFRWLTSRGQKEYIEKAKLTLEWSITGFITIVLAYALTQYIFGLIVK